jgi:hypothetical protein
MHTYLYIFCLEYHIVYKSWFPCSDHWVLVVILHKQGKSYYVDSLKKQAPSHDLKSKSKSRGKGAKKKEDERHTSELM